MKTFLKVWWRGIGALGHYLLASLALCLISFLVDLLPESLGTVVGVAVCLLVVPPMLYWIHRSCYPDSTASASRASGSSQETSRAGLLARRG